MPVIGHKLLPVCLSVCVGVAVCVHSWGRIIRLCACDGVWPCMCMCVLYNLHFIMCNCNWISSGRLRPLFNSASKSTESLCVCLFFIVRGEITSGLEDFLHSATVREEQMTQGQSICMTAGYKKPNNPDLAYLVSWTLTFNWLCPPTDLFTCAWINPEYYSQESHIKLIVY